MKTIPTILASVAYILTAIGAEAQIPQIESVAPGQNGLNVAVGTTVSATFDIDMDELTFNEMTFLVNGSNSGRHTGIYFYNDVTRSIVFILDENFKPGEVVTALLTTGIESAGGIPLADDFSWSFTTIADPAPSTFEVDAHYQIGDWPWRAISADFNNDGHIDIATADNSSRRLSVLLNSGTGTFPTRSTYITAIAPSSLTAADFENDGDLDIAVSCIHGPQQVSILINDGNGIFSGLTSIPVPDLPEDVCAADFDGDGNVDLATANYWHGSVGIYFGAGDGTFAVDTFYWAGDGYPYGICAGDFENDGDIDIAAANMSGGLISVYYNNGDGTFSDLTLYTTGWQSMAILTADLNGDGFLDLATSCVGPDAIAIHLNNGDGTFAERVEYQTSAFPRGISGADFDGDGDIDIAVAGNNTFHVYIHANNGDGTFTLMGRTAVLRYPCAVTSADYDGDGDMDIAAVNRGSDSLSVLYNQGFMSTHLLVTNFHDDGLGSLRWALDSANSNDGVDSIKFALDGTLIPDSPLPALTDNAGTMILGSSVDSYPQRVKLDGSNLITGNGIEIQSSNNIIEGMTIVNFPDNGIVVTGESSNQNMISGNIIYNNGLLGIDLGGDGVTLNDPGDLDTGPNNLINFPETDSAFLVSDTFFCLYGTAGPGDKIEIFGVTVSWDSTINPDPTGHGEAYQILYYYPEENYADENGKFAFEWIHTGVYLGTDLGYVTMLAIDSFGNTSEYSENQALINPFEITAYSPVNLWITDPNGDYIGRDADGNLFQTIETATYTEIETDKVTINRPILGQYEIEIIPETGADPAAKYSIGVTVLWRECMLTVDAAIPAPLTNDTLYYVVEEGWFYKNGDADRNEEINLLDITYLIGFLYMGGPAPYPEFAGDANCNLTVNILDVTYLIAYLYSSGPAPCEVSE